MKIINLKSNGVGRYEDVSPFIIADKTLNLKFNLPAVNGEFYLITEINGVKVKRVISSDGNISLDGLSAGELRAEVKHYLKGELIKAYRIEPLLLKDIDGSLSAEPEIIALRRELNALKETYIREVQEFKDNVENLKGDNLILWKQNNELLEKLVNKVAALMLFAETCIDNIPYINDYKFLEEVKNEN